MGIPGTQMMIDLNLFPEIKKKIWVLNHLMTLQHDRGHGLLRSENSNKNHYALINLDPREVTNW